MYKIFSKETQEVARLIGLFYLEKNNNDYVATEEEIKRLQITDIEVEHCEIIVELSRPGLFIGKRGENVEQLQKYLHEHGFKRKLHIKEAKQNILDFLIPYEYNDEDDSPMMDPYPDMFDPDLDGWMTREDFEARG